MLDALAYECKTAEARLAEVAALGTRVHTPLIARFLVGWRLSCLYRFSAQAMTGYRGGCDVMLPPLDADLEERIRLLERQLRDRLSPEDFELVWQLRHLEELATVAACDAWQCHLLDALARHFPEQELAIRAVAAHVIGTDADCDTLRGEPSGRHGQ